MSRTFDRIRGRLAALHEDSGGVALVEFAFAVPVLAILFVGGYQSLDAISAYRKVSTTVRTMADLTTQSTTLTTAQADAILSASQQVMAPYPINRASLRITQIKIPANNQPVVAWSRQINDAGRNGLYDVGDTISVPDNIKQPNTWIIYSEINYNYVPNIASTMIGTIPFRDQILMSPRNSASIALN